MRAVIGSYIYSTTPEETVESVLARLLQKADASVALVETLSGGAIADRMKNGFNPEDVVRVFEADQDTASLRQLLDKPPASEVALDLALRLREECNVSHGLAVITSGSPDETFHSNQGGETWIGCAGPDRTEVARFPFGGADRLTNAWVGNRAMDILRRILLDLEV